MIKNENLFHAFLTTISFSPDEFFENAVYVIPSVFTPHLIRYIKVTYLGQTLCEKSSKKKLKKSKKEKINDESTMAEDTNN